MESHTLMDGKVHVYRRENSGFWQCAVFLGGRNHRQTTRQKSLALAMDFAREWYMERYADDRLRRRGLPLPTDAEREAAGEPLFLRPRPKAKPAGPTFRHAADTFVAEYRVITQGERNPKYVERKSQHLRLYLLPFFGDRPLEEVTAGLIQEYRVHRLNPPETPSERRSRGRAKAMPKRPARSTIHQELVTLRQVLKTANRKGWIAALPDMTAPYKASGKVSHRAWFSPDEYKRLYEATRERARNPIRVLAYAISVASTSTRQSGVSAVLDAARGGAQTQCFSEIAFPPFGYLLMLGTEPADRSLVDITEFTSFQYDATGQALTLTLPIRHVSSPFPGDFRSSGQIALEAQRNRTFFPPEER